MAVPGDDREGFVGALEAGEAGEEGTARADELEGGMGEGIGDLDGGHGGEERGGARRRRGEVGKHREERPGHRWFSSSSWISLAG